MRTENGRATSTSDLDDIFDQPSRAIFFATEQEQQTWDNDEQQPLSTEHHKSYHAGTPACTRAAPPACLAGEQAVQDHKLGTSFFPNQDHLHQLRRLHSEPLAGWTPRQDEFSMLRTHSEPCVGQERQSFEMPHHTIDHNIYACTRNFQVTPPLPMSVQEYNRPAINTSPSQLFEMQAREYHMLMKESQSGALVVPPQPAPASPVAEKKRKTINRDPNLPKRPLSAYNIFFRQERARINGEVAQETRNTSDETKRQRRLNPTHKLGFASLAREIGARWKELKSTDPDRYDHIQSLAAVEMQHYKVEKAEYERKAKLGCVSEESKEKDASPPESRNAA